MKEISSLMQRATIALRSVDLLFSAKDFESTISRSYYAMFYITEAVLLTKELKFSSHKSVISLFGMHFIKTGIFKPELGKTLNKTFEKRLLSDYSYAPVIAREDAKEVIDSAKDFIKTLKRYLVDCGYSEST